MSPHFASCKTLPKSCLRQGVSCQVPGDRCEGTVINFVYIAIFLIAMTIIKIEGMLCSPSAVSNSPKVLCASQPHCNHRPHTIHFMLAMMISMTREDCQALLAHPLVAISLSMTDEVFRVNGAVAFLTPLMNMVIVVITTSKCGGQGCLAWHGAGTDRGRLWTKSSLMDLDFEFQVAFAILLMCSYIFSFAILFFFILVFFFNFFLDHIFVDIEIQDEQEV